MTAQVLFLDAFFEKDPHLNAVEYLIRYTPHFNLSKILLLLCRKIV